MNIKISGLINPPSTSPTGSFSVSTYYESTDNTLVATGTLDPIAATVDSIASANVDVTASSYVVNEAAVTYSLQMTIVNGIPAGGYFDIKIPSEIAMDEASTPSHCSININSTSYISTDCTVGIINSSSAVTFTNPFPSDAVAGTVFIARISTVFTNPISTEPTSSFGIYTYHSNGFSIAEIDTSLTVQMNTASSFNSFGITRGSSKNYETTIYTFSFNQVSPIEASGKIILNFPSDVTPSANSVVTLTAPSSQLLVSSLTNSIFTITLPAASIATGTTVTFTINNILNPPSFAPAGNFILQTKTANNLYLYTYGISSVSLINDAPSAFEAITSEFTP